MKRMLKTVTMVLAVGATAGVLLQSAIAQNAAPTARTNGKNFHAFPTVGRKPALPADFGPLIYNNPNAPVMQNGVTPYVIFWVPPTLQSGAATSLTAHYETVQKNVLGDYAGHGIANNNTQYYQIIAGVKKFIQNKGAAVTAADTYIDTNPYPASGCTDTATPKNCITDLQLETELQRVMTLNAWTGGLNKMFFVYTSKGEGSCFDNTNASCAYTAYCAYHSFYMNGTVPVIYANQPYGNPNYCQVPGTPSPNKDIPADTAASTATHEFTEAITDPELDAWFTSQGNEIGDLCAYDYGLFYDWDGGLANEMWNGRFYMLQQEFDNNSLGCVQIGPN
jgi:hypothetical protein